MPRPSHPWWWKERKRWAVTVRGKRHLAPEILTESDWLAARDWHARLIEELKPGSIRKAGALTVADLCNAFLVWDGDRAKKDERDADSHRVVATQLGLFCATEVDGRRLGYKPAIQLTAGDLEAAMSAWREQHRIAVGAKVEPGKKRSRKGRRSQGYIVAIIAGIRGVYGWAYRPVPGRIPERLIQENPLAGFKGPPVPESKARFAQRAEAAAWLRWLRSRGVEKSFILIQRALIHSGARPSELVNARWKHVDWEGWETESGHPGAIVTLEEWKNARKTGKVRRVFLMPVIRRSLLRDLAKLPDDPERALFINAWDEPWANAKTLGDRVKRQRDAAIGADKEARKKDPSVRVRFRDIGEEALVNYRWRHTAASTLIMNGVDVTTVAELLGTSEVMIRRTYGHLLIDHLAKAASKISRRR